MDSILWFFIILGVIVGLIVLGVVGAVIWDLFLNGGCALLIGIGIIAGALAMIRIGGPTGGFGIFILLVGLGMIGVGASMLKEWWNQ
jgi:hypothetical protein